MLTCRALLLLTLTLTLLACDAGVVQWNSSRPPIFMDLDGDEVLDVIGWVRVQRRGQLSPRVAAFAGKSGQQLWISPELATLAEEHQAQFGFAGGRLVVVDPGGKAHAFVPNVDTPEWSIDLGERAAEICEGGASEVVVVTKDGTARAVAVADGSARPVPAPVPCISTGALVPAAIRAHWHAVGLWPGVRLPPVVRRPRRDIAEMTEDSLLSPAPGVTVVLGSKTTGTRVPMVAVLRDEHVQWTSVVPQHEPLRAETGGPKIAAADEQAVFVGYETADTRWHVAAFMLLGGQRLWDAEVGEGRTDDLEMIVPVGDRVYAAHWTYLDVLDRNTGALLYTIGAW